MKCWCGKGRKEEGDKKESFINDGFLVWSEKNKAKKLLSVFFLAIFYESLSIVNHLISSTLISSIIMDHYRSEDRVYCSGVKVLWSMNLNSKTVIYELYDHKPSSIETGLKKATISSEIMHINCLAKFLIESVYKMLDAYYYYVY